MKHCNRCKKTKPLSEFGKHSQYKSGINSRCIQCCREVRNAYYRANPESALKGQREWRKKNREHVQNYMQKWNSGRKDYRRNYLFKKAYGITLEQYSERLKSQSGRCACCGTDNPGGRSGVFFVDHCHLSKKVRGLLCNRCNFAIGNLNDSIQTTLKAALYLIRNGSIEEYAESELFLSEDEKKTLNALAQNGWRRPAEVAA